MWCANCRAEVAADVGADNRRIRCATCANDLGVARGLEHRSPEQSARELLERWTRTPLPEIPAPLGADSLSEEADPAPNFRPQTPAVEQMPQKEAPKSPTTRQSESPRNLDSTGEEPEFIPEAAPRTAPDRPQFSDYAEQEIMPQDVLRVDRPHVEDQRESRPPQPARQRPRADQVGSEAASAPPPGSRPLEVNETYDVHVRPREITVPTRETKPSSNWQSSLGQCLAYFGVGGLTLGTSLAIWSFYGGPANYAPTGWLIMTAGQMLLFLGVITLVSGGMEQSAQEMSRRFDELSERIIRLESGSRNHGLHGPHVPVSNFAQGGRQAPPKHPARGQDDGFAPSRG